MTTHLTQDDPVEEEPELVLIDDEEYEAAHRYDETGDEYGDDEDEFEFSFEEYLDEAIALDLSDSDGSERRGCGRPDGGAVQFAARGVSS